MLRVPIQMGPLLVYVNQALVVMVYSVKVGYFYNRSAYTCKRVNYLFYLSHPHRHVCRFIDIIRLVQEWNSSANRLIIINLLDLIKLFSCNLSVIIILSTSMVNIVLILVFKPVQCTLGYAIRHGSEANGLNKQEWPD